MVLVAAPVDTVGATADAEWTGQDHSDVAQGADTRPEGEAHRDRL